MKIYLIRHGETVNNQNKRLQGRSDTALNDNGIRQAEAVHDFFQSEDICFDRIYTSPLQRAVQTAEIISAGRSDIVIEPRLLEMDYGPYEGCSLEAPPPEIIRFFQDFVHNPAPDGMEDLSQVKTRLGSFLDEICGCSFESVLLTTHAIAMKGALEYMDPAANGSYWSKYIGNCAVYRIDYVHNTFLMPEEIYTSGYTPGV